MTRVLFIDDNTETLELFEELYSHSSCVYTAENGRDAALTLTKHPVDVVFVDITLNDNENGYVLAQEISRAYPETAVRLMSSLEKQFVQKHYGQQFEIFSKIQLVFVADIAFDSTLSMAQAS